MADNPLSAARRSHPPSFVIYTSLHGTTVMDVTRHGHMVRTAAAYFGARFTAASRLAFAEPGRSGLGWL